MGKVERVTNWVVVNVRYIVAYCTFTAIVVMMFVGGFVRLSLAHVDTTSYVIFVSAIGTTLGAQVLTYIKQMRNGDKIDDVHKDVQVVKEQTNGKLTELVETVKSVADNTKTEGK